jgi:DNA helicase II / ATP-dependent DNA helicase PcrA
MNAVVLTDEQEYVVSLRDGSFLVLAPPGTGKTEVIAHRIVRLLADSPGASFRVLALTFNNRAAAAMRSRVRELLRKDTWRATVETYHSFYLDILRHYGTLIGIPPEVTVYDTVDSRIHALRQGLTDEGFVLTEEELERQEAERILDEISRMKRSLITPTAAPTRTTGLRMSLREAYDAYEGALRRNGAVDFDGMLTRTYELLTDHPQVADHYRRLYRYILVDEAQDTSTVQFEILRTICGDTHRNVFMVADPDQLINRWLGADRRNLDRFVSEFGATTLHLSTNFRCADRIVGATNRLLDRDPKAPPILPSGRAPGAVLAASYADERVEAAAVVDWITRLREDGLSKEWLADVEETEVPPNQLAVLARSRLHLREVLTVLSARHLPYVFRAGDVGPFDSTIYRVTLDGLRVLANPRDLALRRTLLGSVGQELDESGDELEIASTDLPHFLAVAAERDTIGAGALIACLASASDIGFTMSTLTEPLFAEAAESDLAELLRADRELLASRWSTYKNSTESQNWTWSGVVMSILDEPREDPDGIRVSTVHAAKGLEFRAVAIVGMNDGSFPDFRNIDDPDELASERRLAYVAATRASRALLLTRPRTRATRFGAKGQTPSRFLDELGVHVQDL